MATGGRLAGVGARGASPGTCRKREKRSSSETVVKGRRRMEKGTLQSAGKKGGRTGAPTTTTRRGGEGKRGTELGKRRGSPTWTKKKSLSIPRALLKE